MDMFEELAAVAPFGDGRVQLGFACDLLFQPKEVVQPMFQRAMPGAKLFTHHDIKGGGGGSKGSALEDLVSKGLLGGSAKTILSHANGLLPSQIPEMKKHGVSIAISPTTELGMGMGNPPPVALRVPEFDDLCSLGIDCHSATSAFLPGQARELMGAARAKKHAEGYADSKWFRALGSREPSKQFPTALRAFNMMTLGGARAVGMDKSIGQLKEGYKADIVVWDTSSPALLAAVEEDPVSAVVFHSSIRDVQGVLVDGIVRKWQGSLLDVPVDAGAPEPLKSFQLPVASRTGSLAWKDVAAQVLQARVAVKQKEAALQVDMREQEEVMIDLFHMDRSMMIS